jgi:hypothetical protein
VTLASDSTGVVSVDDNGGALTVDNGGTFAVQVSSQVPGTGATNLGKAEGSAYAAGHTVVGVAGVRNDAGTIPAGVDDGDYMLPQFDANGALYVTGGGGGTQYVEDAAAAANPTASALNLIRDDARGGSLTSTDGDNVAARGTNAGELYVKHVDAIPVTDNAGSLTVDNAALSVTGGGVEASALRVTIASDSTGVLSVDDNGGSLTVDNGGTFAVQATIAAGATSHVHLEDVASGDGDGGVGCLAVRKATPANTSGTDGDYEFLQMSAGRLWASAVIDTALPAGTNNIGDVDVLSIAAGTNLVGDVALNGRATGSSIATVRFVSAATTNLTEVKDTAGTLYGVHIASTRSSAVYLRFYNIVDTGVTVGTSTVKLTLIGPGATTGAGHTFLFPLGIPFSTAISCSLTAGSLADNDTTATAASEAVVNIMYV